MDTCKKPVAVLQQVYTRCCSLREFRKEVILAKVLTCDRENSMYDTLLDNVVVCIPSLFSVPADIPPEDSTSFQQFNELIKKLQHSFFVWRDKSLPELPVFDVNLYYQLFCDVGERWFTELFNNCGLFAKVSAVECLWQIGGPPSYEQYCAKKKKLNEGDASTEDTESRAQQTRSTKSSSFCQIICWRNLLHRRNYRFGFSCCNLVDRLSKEEPSNDAGAKVMLAIWPSWNEQNEKKAATDSSSAINKVVLCQLFEEFIVNHRRFDFVASFKHHCPDPRLREEVMPVELNKVVAFIKAVIFKTIPLKLLGSRRNQIVFQKFVAYILRLGFGDQPSVEHLEKMRVEDCSAWISGDYQAETVRSEYFRILLWILNEYLIVGLASFFYVTEISGESRQLFYYPQKMWKTLEIQAMEGLVQTGRFSLVDDLTAKLMLENGKLTLQNLRFVPKSVPTLQLRPILIRKRKHLSADDDRRQLKKDLSILNYILTSDIKYRGSSIAHASGTKSTFHTRWQKFVQNCRASKVDQLYFVKLDIKDCFNRINHAKLFEILRRVSKEEKLKTVWLRSHFILRSLNRKPKVIYRQIVGPPRTSFSEVCSPYDERSRNKVITNLNRVEVENISAVVKRVEKEVKRNMVYLNRKYYQQIQGVSQGGSLSQALCNIYIGDMEREHLSEFIPEQENELLLRYVDDYLFVTSDRSRAEKFKTRLGEGLTEYEACINDAKSTTNFQCDFGQVEQTMDFSGFQIDTESLEVSVNYSRNEGKSLSHRFLVTASRGLQGIKEMVMYNVNLNDKLVLIDGRICKSISVVRNLFKLVLMVVFKLRSGLIRLPCAVHEKVKEDPDELVGIVTAAITNIAAQVSEKRRMGALKWPFKIAIVKWICLQAAIRTFQRHHRQYKLLIQRFVDLQTSLEKKMKKRTIRFLYRAVGKLPRAFKKIRD